LDKIVPLLIILKEAVVSVARWIQIHNGFVSATATVVMAAFTGVLWWTTRNLWKASKKQAEHMESSIAVAQKTADAARKSADALEAIERARLFIRIEHDPPLQIGQVIEGIKKGHNAARIIIINEGKTLAIITKINYFIGVMEDREIDNKIAELTKANSEMPYGAITIRSNDTKEIPVSCEIDSADLKKVHESMADYVCLGQIRYKDVFRKVRPVGFCWKYSHGKAFFVPDENPKRNET
jgi:hypothetical protein